MDMAWLIPVLIVVALVVIVGVYLLSLIHI